MRVWLSGLKANFWLEGKPVFGFLRFETGEQKSGEQIKIAYFEK